MQRSDWSKSNEAPECGDLIGRERCIASLVSGLTGLLPAAVAARQGVADRPDKELPGRHAWKKKEQIAYYTAAVSTVLYYGGLPFRTDTSFRDA